jgi:hypothetical protein
MQLHNMNMKTTKRHKKLQTNTDKLGLQNNWCNDKTRQDITHYNLQKRSNLGSTRHLFPLFLVRVVRSGLCACHPPTIPRLTTIYLSCVFVFYSNPVRSKSQGPIQCRYFQYHSIVAPTQKIGLQARSHIYPHA